MFVLKTLKNFFISLADCIAPRRMDAMLVGGLEKDDILKLPPASEAENAPWIHPLFRYKNNSVRAVVWELKYRENTAPLAALGEILYEEIIALVSDIVLFDSDAKFLLVPIPLSAARRAERGYNQSELLAKAVLPFDTEHILTYAPQYLQKIFETPRQSRSVSRLDRQKNLVGCFSADPRVLGAYVILIDDVVTTGSTLSEARVTLLAAGTRDVFAFTVAH
jgi:ComF family protein